MAKKTDYMTEMATKFGKHDLERLGLFIEMPYMNGKGYVSPFPKRAKVGGRNIMCGGPKIKCGTQDGYFDDEFRRLFIGEGIPKKPKQKGKIAALKPFVPPGSTKWHSTPGDYYGTFGGVIKAFGTGRVTKKIPYIKQKPNCLTGPSKKGGPGYADICLSKYPEHLKEPYRPKIKYKEYGKNLGRAMYTVHFPQPYFEKNPFFEEKLGRVYLPPKPKPPGKQVGDGKWIPTGPTKWQGGCHAGMFSLFPAHETDRDPKMEAKLKKQQEMLKKKAEERGKFSPQSMALKNMLTSSVLMRNAQLCVNATNYKTYETSYTKYLLAKQE